MLQEALVIFACLNNAGCNETSASYYATHPEVRQFVKENERKIVKILGPVIVENVGPIIIFGAGGTASMRLPAGFSTQIDKNHISLTFSKEF